MKKLILTTLVLLTSSFPAFAQNDLALCKLRAQHISDTGVAYKPGVDVNGNDVVPADVSAAPSIVPDNIRIPMTVDLAKRLGTTPIGTELNAEMGFVEIRRDGQVTFNGQDLTSQTNIACGNDVIAPATAAATTALSAPAPLNALNAASDDVVVVAPPDAPALPIATTSVNARPLPRPSVAPVASPTIPSNAKALPPQQKNTLGQLVIPSTSKKPEPVAIPSIAGGAKADINMNADDIVYGEGN